MKLVLLSIAVVGLSIVLLGVKVLFVKGGRFPSSHVGSSKALRDKGISCAHDDRH
ncbi:MAG: hypothetical protein K2M54_09345 [Muribaculaceae bacterium]|nr:hypothetical protein [Muribaculaceae bacterium]MDE7458101.1 hypothetical protein [Muribaculaceae bacterium]